MDAEDDNPGLSPARAPEATRTAPAASASAPPVTLMVVTHDPGTWFEESLGAISALDYPALDVVVVDAASREPVDERVRRSLPHARIVRLEDNPGFGRAIDAARSRISVAPLLVLAHDDVAPDQLAVRALVEEAFRSNAAVVGPKIARWDDPTRLLAAGEGADKFGFPVPTLERGELDQEQHDAVRDVFNVPDAFTLVRTDLLDAIGGFDPDGSWFGDDLDLCWRAHVAGGRVLVAPAARVRHLEALGERRPVDDRRRLQFRHRLRVMLGAYGRFSLLRIVPQLVVVHVVEAVFSLVTGRPGHARDVVTAWTWNLARLPSLRARRAALRAVRRIPDAEIRSLQVGGSARIAAFLRGQLAVGDDPFGSAATLGRRLVDMVAGPGRRAALVAWMAVALVLVLGSRHLLTRPIPAVGQLVPFPEQVGPLLSEWASSWRRAGTGSEGFAASAEVLLALASAAFLGASGLLRTVVLLGMLPLGLFGVWRLVAPAHSVRASIVGLLAYAAVPLGFDSLSTGSWRGLLGFGLAPWVIARVLRASGEPPFGEADPPAGPRVDVPPLWRQALVLGVLVAIPAAVDPLWIVTPLVIVVAMVPGSLVAGRLRGLLRMTLAGLGAALVAAALHGPWVVELLGRDVEWSTFTGGRTGDAPHIPLLDLLRFDTGPIGSPLNAAVLVAAAYVLVVGRGWRLSWAARAWSIALAAWGVVWAAGMGWVPVALPPTEVLLAPAGAALALSAGLGAAAFDLDVRRRGFSWRQLASVVAVGSLVVAVLPVLAASVGGRWLVPRGDHQSSLAFLDEAAAESDMRVVWFGHPDVLPLTGWPLADDVAYATTLDGTPVAQDLWPGNPEPSGAPLRRSVQLALDAETSRLGRILAPMGVRYLVLVERAAPAPYGGTVRSLPPELVAALDAQLDLERIDVNPAVTVYRNAAWAPPVSVLPAGTVPASDGPLVPDGARAAAALDLAALAEPLRRSDVSRAAGDATAGSEILVGSTPSTGWDVTVDGDPVDQRPAFGWATAADADAGGDVEVSWATPLVHRLALAGQVLVVLVVAATMYATRAERRDMRRATRPVRVERRASRASSGRRSTGRRSAGTSARRRRR